MKVKKYILGGFIALFGAINISSADVYTGTLPGTIYNTTYGNYSYWYSIDNKLNFRTNGEYNNIFYTAQGCESGCGFRGSRSWILFRNNGKIAGYGNINTDSTHRIITQGYYNAFCSADTSNYTTYCTPVDNTHGNYTTNIDTFYSQGAIYDSYYFNTNTVRPYICFIATNYNKVSCFTMNVSNNSSAVIDYITPETILTTNSNEDSGFASEKTKFQTSVFYTTNNNTLPTTTGYSCPTVGQLLNTYGTDYNKNLCYSNNLIYSGGTIHTITPESIFTLYPTLTGFMTDINTYNSYCTTPNNTTACQTMFENKEIEYTLIAKIPNTVQPMKLYQYCNLSLNYDPNTTTCTAGTGAIPGIGDEGVDINDAITEIGEGDYEVITPGRPPEREPGGTGGAGGGGGGSRGDENDDSSGSVYDSLIGNQENDTERWNVIENAKNIIKTMKELYAKFTGIFRERGGREGIIPTYITGLILLIVLFKLWKR